MYSFKEKQKHFSELKNPDAAFLDLKLLTQKSPLLFHLKKFSRNPQRYANEILYQLLDVAQRDEIRKNRRSAAPQKEQSKSNKANASNTQKKENTTQEPPVPVAGDEKPDVTNQITEAEERAEEAELRAEEAEERADNAEATLEQEKKKVVTTPKPASAPKVKSKSGKNTPKSTGTTSQTRKSKQPPSSTTTES